MANIWAKRDKESNVNRLLSLLTKNKELTFKNLSDGLKVSNPTLTEYIKLLEIQGKIERFNKAGDRRNQWYRIKLENIEQVTNQLGKYEAIKFIKSVPQPVYKYKKTGDLSVAAFVTKPHNQPREVFEKKVEAILDEKALKLLKAFLRVKPSKGKLALVIMMDAENEGDKV